MIHRAGESLSPALRATAEDAMKDDNQYLTTCTAAALELGIDVGKLGSALPGLTRRLRCPASSNGWAGRVADSNPPGMHFVMREEHPESRAMLPDLIPWPGLLRGALVQLYIEERWVEPPEPGRLPYSLLYHQTMTSLASDGEMTPARLASRVLTLTYFHNVSQDDYRVLLRHLLKTKQIQRTENGGLIVGLAGERVVNNFKFYAVFQENIEYSVHAGSEELGTIVQPPPVGDKIAIAGRVWVVEDIDRQRHQVYCHEVWANPGLLRGMCRVIIQPKILQRMRRVLTEDKMCSPYLMGNAKAKIDSGP